jgi:hypothetical protein
MAQFYTLEEAARVLGMNPEELKTQAQSRKVRAFMDSGSWRFRVADVDELARRRGMGSDPDLSLSDLDLVTQPESSSDENLMLSEYQLGVASPDIAPPSGGMKTHDSDQDILADDLSLPPEQLTGSSSTILGMQPSGKRPSDSDVKVVPEGAKGSSDSDVRIMPKGATPSASDVRLAPTPSSSDVRLAPGSGSGSGSQIRPTPEGKSDSDVKLGKGQKGLAPSDSDVTMVSDELGSGSSDSFPATDPGETTMRPSPFGAGSSGDVAAIGDDSSDFELTPSSVIDALEPESGSDFELTALDSSSDEYEATPMRGPSDSDVTAAEPAASGINLARPSDSGINLQSMGTIESADSIELAPLEEDAVPTGRKPAPKKEKADLSATALPKKADLSATALPKKADLSATALPKKADLSATALPKKADLSATALPQKADLSKTSLPLKADKDIFEDTDFEVDALDTSGDDRTVQLEAASDFDLEDSDSASEVFAIDEDDVDQAAATAMGPAIMEEEEEAFGEEAEGVPGEGAASAWDVEAEATPSQVVAARAAAPVLAPSAAAAEWGGIWVGLLCVATVFMLLLAFVGMDLVRNLYDFRGDYPASGLIRSIAGMITG